MLMIIVAIIQDNKTKEVRGKKRKIEAEDMLVN